ncbi:MAG: lipoate--protein ligase family protein [Gemmatimonadales bacterium]
MRGEQVSGERDLPRADLSPLTSHLLPLTWTLLIHDPAPGWYNMAVDSALLDLAGQEGLGFLRLYRWEPHCLSFGRNESARCRYDRERIRGLGLDCVRRPTGGRAVWHARELTYAVAAPLHPFGGLQQAFRRIHDMLAQAIRTLGADPRLAPPGPLLGPAAGPCFAACAGGEVIVSGRKVVGSAQLQHGTAFLQHGSLLLEDDQSLVRNLAEPPSHPAVPPSSPPAVPTPLDAPLSRLLTRTVTFDEAARAIMACAQSVLHGEITDGRLPSQANRLIEQHAARFRSPEWTWSR